MIPYKIYFGFDEETHLESYCLEKKGKCQLEYIRKDTLLEWAKGEIMPGNSAEGKGWNLALQTLLEKLESL